jgi:CubicO group peptidase (beta-lactamase class C family)
MRIDDHMRLASVAKAFSGATALSLVSKGVLSLGDTIGELLPKLPKAWHGVALRQLLNHTSGIPDLCSASLCSCSFCSPMGGCRAVAGDLLHGSVPPSLLPWASGSPLGDYRQHSS